MSASERLRELDAAIMHGYLRDGGGPLATLSLALPEIVAVVEAAEREHPAPHNYWAIDADMNEIKTCPTCAVLAALEEKLKP